MATTIPADIAICEHPDFAAVEHSTKWVEDVLDLSGVSATGAAPASDDDDPKVRRDVDVEVNGKKFSVSMWVPESAMAATGAAPKAKKARRGGGSGGAAVGGGDGTITVPMQGTIVKVSVEVGDSVEAGDTVVVLEAMKMENNVATDVSGTVSEIKVAAGDAVGGGDTVVIIEPAG